MKINRFIGAIIFYMFAISFFYHENLHASLFSKSTSTQSTAKSSKTGKKTVTMDTNITSTQATPKIDSNKLKSKTSGFGKLGGAFGKKTETPKVGGKFGKKTETPKVDANKLNSKTSGFGKLSGKFGKKATTTPTDTPETPKTSTKKSFFAKKEPLSEEEQEEKDAKKLASKEAFKNKMSGMFSMFTSKASEIMSGSVGDKIKEMGMGAVGGIMSGQKPKDIFKQTLGQAKDVAQDAAGQAANVAGEMISEETGVDTSVFTDVTQQAIAGKTVNTKQLLNQTIKAAGSQIAQRTGVDTATMTSFTDAAEQATSGQKVDVVALAKKVDVVSLAKTAGINAALKKMIAKLAPADSAFAQLTEEQINSAATILSNPNVFKALTSGKITTPTALYDTIAAIPELNDALTDLGGQELLAMLPESISIDQIRSFLPASIIALLPKPKAKEPIAKPIPTPAPVIEEPEAPIEEIQAPEQEEVEPEPVVAQQAPAQQAPMQEEQVIEQDLNELDSLFGEVDSNAGDLGDRSTDFEPENTSSTEEPIEIDNTEGILA